MRIRQWTIAAFAPCLLLAASACKQSEPPATKPAPPPPQAAAPAPVAFRVVTVDLGKSVTPDRRVAQPTTAFAPADTIYASVVSEGVAPSVALKARWTFEDGQLVNEASQTIAPAGPAATEFHVSKPGGWPTGRYKVETSADGSAVATREFAVD